MDNLMNKISHQCEADLVVPAIEHSQLSQLQLEPLEVCLTPHSDIVVHIGLGEEVVEVGALQLVCHVVEATGKVHECVVQI